MSDDPYRPPSSPVGDGTAGERRRSTPVAVAIGLAADVGATIVASVVVNVFVALAFTGGGTAPEELERALGDSVGYQLFGVMLGLACTVLGGYVAARVANTRELYHGLLLGLASLAIGELYIAFFAPDILFWQRLASDLFVIPAAIVGARIRKVRSRAA